MKILSLFFALLILVPVLCFALSNRQDIDIACWPFEGSLQLPLYLLGLGPLAFGLVLGGIWGWACGFPHRLKARRLTKEMAALREQALDWRKEPALSAHTPIFFRRFWKRSS